MQDARRCLAAGAGGIVVSHHHGIQDYAVPPLRVLPDILKEVNGRIPVFVDCGISSGMDVFKAMALGASAVSVGRKMMEYLHVSGAAGVEQAIHEMTGELATAMARTGTRNLFSFDPSVIWSS